MSRYEHPVFGPDRRAAALDAINELAASGAPLTGYSDYDTLAMRTRHEAAKEARAHYMEYGTSYDEHAALRHTA